jgi:hypothetical protein
MLFFSEWLYHTSISVAIRESSWVFPIIETTHVLGLSLSVGVLFVSDLRLVGLALRRRPASELWGQLKPWMVAGFVVMFSSGALLFWSQPIKAYQSVFFRAKLAFLLLAAFNAAVYHTTIFRRTNEWDDAPVPPAQARLTGWISLALWAGVIAAGRTMAYTL